MVKFLGIKVKRKLGKALERWQTAAEKKSHRLAQARYQKSPEEVQKRVNRNKARRHMIAEGKASKGDGTDVDHQNGDPLDNSPSNWRVISRHRNRAYPRDSKAHKLYKSVK